LSTGAPHNTRPTWILAAGLASLLLFDLPSRADDPADDYEKNKEVELRRAAMVDLERRFPRTRTDNRTLKYHAFTEPYLTDSPWIVNYVQLRIGPGLTVVPRRPEYQIETPVLGYAGGLLSLGFGLVLHERIGIDGRLETQASVGTSSLSLYYVGADIAASWDWRLSFRILRREQAGFQLTAAIKTRGYIDRAIEPERLEESIDVQQAETLRQQALDGEVPWHLLTNERLVLGGGSLSAGKAFGRHLSLQAAVEVMAGKHLSQFAWERERYRSLRVGGGVTATVDGWPHFPAALVVEYRGVQRWEWDGDGSHSSNRHRMAAGVYHTLRQKTSPGLVLSWPLTSPTKASERLFWAVVVLKGYWE